MRSSTWTGVLVDSPHEPAWREALKELLDGEWRDIRGHTHLASDPGDDGPMLKQSEAASIVTMSSLAGRFGYPNRIAYSSTKWALVGFSKTLAMELGPFVSPPTPSIPARSPGSRMSKVLHGRAEASGKTQLLILLLFVVPGFVYQGVRINRRGRLPSDVDLSTRLVGAIVASAVFGLV